MISSTDGWIVGASGDILHWNGTSWSLVSSPISQAINSVSMVSISDGWAVANSGKILRWDGTSWSEFTDIGNQTLDVVFMTSSTDGWIVNGGGLIEYWNGTSWVADTSPTTRNLMSVIFTSSSSGWAVGANGTILRHVGSFASSGTYLSSVLDTDAGNAGWDTIFFTATIPAPTTLSVALRSGNTLVPDGSWSAWSTEMTTSTGVTIPSSPSRYIQYRLTLTTSDTAQTPSLNDITVTYHK